MVKTQLKCGNDGQFNGLPSVSVLDAATVDGIDIAK